MDQNLRRLVDAGPKLQRCSVSLAVQTDSQSLLRVLENPSHGSPYVYARDMLRYYTGLRIGAE
jgi:hypothetical protein